jgi:DNA-binding NtrC family response regulator
MTSPDGIHVLLVEDQELVRETLAMLIEMLGHRVTAAESAEDALALLDAGRFDMLLSDLTLPGMSGLALAQLVAERQPGIRLVLSSGYGVVDEVKRSGLDIVLLPKPIDNDKLVALLESTPRRP